MKKSNWKNSRGSVMVIAVVFAAIMALSVTSFLKLANSEARLASVAFYSNSSLNLAEAGVEKALYALNNEDWTGWNVMGSQASMQTETLDLGNSVTGIIQARVLSLNNNPTVQAEGRMQLPGRPEVVKQIEVQLTRRSLFSNGITTRRGVRFKGGNAYVDSYRSSLGLPSVTNRYDRGSVASTSVETDAITLSNSTVYGRVATGGSWPSVGPNGRIYGTDTPSWLKVDPERVALDFAADFPEPDVPSVTPDQYIPNISGTTTIGIAGATTPQFIRVDSIDLSGQSILRFQGPVVVYLTGSLSVGGKAEIIVDDGPGMNTNVTFYVDGNMSIGGNGTFNATNDPANLVIFGTNRNYQQFTLHGQGILQAAVYAPNAEVDLKGGGSIGAMNGALVADRVTINGNYQFHYDEDLEDKFAESGYGMERWRELHKVSDRITF